MGLKYHFPNDLCKPKISLVPSSITGTIIKPQHLTVAKLLGVVTIRAGNKCLLKSLGLTGIFWFLVPKENNLHKSIEQYTALNLLYILLPPIVFNHWLVLTLHETASYFTPSILSKHQLVTTQPQPQLCSWVWHENYPCPSQPTPTHRNLMASWTSD